jgi:hypothetical protein
VLVVPRGEEGDHAEEDDEADQDDDEEPPRLLIGKVGIADEARRCSESSSTRKVRIK